MLAKRTLGKSTFIPNTRCIPGLDRAGGELLSNGRAKPERRDPATALDISKPPGFDGPKKGPGSTNKGESHERLRAMPSWYHSRERSMNHRLPFPSAHRSFLLLRIPLLFQTFTRDRANFFMLRRPFRPEESTLGRNILLIHFCESNATQKSEEYWLRSVRNGRPRVERCHRAIRKSLFSTPSHGCDLASGSLQNEKKFRGIERIPFSTSRRWAIRSRNTFESCDSDTKGWVGIDRHR